MIVLVGFVIFNAVCFFVLLKTGFMEIFQDEGSFEAYLEKSGNFMTVLFILLQFLQVVILPIPRGTTQKTSQPKLRREPYTEYE